MSAFLISTNYLDDKIIVLQNRVMNYENELVIFFPKLAQCQQSWKYALLEMCMWKPMKQKPWTKKKIPFHYMNMMDAVNWANGNIYTWPYGQ